MFFRRLMLVALAILFRMEQRAQAGTNYYMYCTTYANCSMLATVALHSWGYKLFVGGEPDPYGLMGRMQQTCVNNNGNNYVACFSTDAVTRIKAQNAWCFGTGVPVSSATIEAKFDCGSKITSGYISVCAVSFGTTTCCDDGYYLTSTACVKCPSYTFNGGNSSEDAFSGGTRKSIKDCYIKNGSFTDGKGTYTFSSGSCYYS